MTKEKLIIDATNAPLGRVSAHAAKQALKGKSIVIVNCNEATISGRKTTILEKYKTSIARGSYNLKGPHIPKSPERLIKRTIRGMLPYKRLTGSEALKRIICYNKTPAEYENSKKVTLEKEFKVKTLKLKELCKLI